MVKILPLAELNPGALPRMSPRLPVFDIALCATHRCDARAVVIRDGEGVAGCSLWWSEAPPYPGGKAGIIGHFAALDAQCAGELLDEACLELARHGCTVAIGPMDGNTWRRYRVLTDRGDEPPFFLEPDNPDEWRGFFEGARFSPLAVYFSALNDDLTVIDPRIPRTMERLERAGLTLRPLRADDFAGELRRIYQISVASFQSNFLYTPVSEQEFMAQYEKIRAHVRPEMVILAECGGAPIGFVFGIPDLAQAQRGEAVDTAVLKTVAVVPGRSNAGLGTVLVSACQQAARALGFKRAIHALMHESNNSLNLSGHYAKPFRRYTLYSRALKTSR